MGRQALDLPGDAKHDLWIIQELANRLGLDWQYSHVSDVYEEMRQAMPSITGISWKRLLASDSVTYPCSDKNDPGQPVMKLPTMNIRTC